MSDNLTDAMPFAKLLGIEVEQADKDCIRGRLQVRPDLCTTGNIMHGGAIMTLADALGGVGAFLNMPEGAAGTVTVESKTNFLGTAPEGSVVSAEATPVKTGRRLSVWQTRISGEDGSLIALVIQSQLYL